MSREEDAVIAEWMGWKWDGVTATSPTGGRNAMIERDPFWWLPRYTTDLNAMAEAEAHADVMTLGYEYGHALADIVDPGGDELDEALILIIRATAAQKAEALVRVIEATK